MVIFLCDHCKVKGEVAPSASLNGPDKWFVVVHEKMVYNFCKMYCLTDFFKKRSWRRGVLTEIDLPEEKIP